MSRTIIALGWFLLLLVLVALPLSPLGDNQMLLVNIILVYAIFAVGFDLAFGLTGLLSLSHAAFFGVGGYTLALLTIRLHWPFELALLASGVSGAVLAGVIGFFSLRLTGIFFALTTLSFGQLCYIVVSTRARSITGGIDGLTGVPRPMWPGIDFYVDKNFYGYVAVIFVVLLVAAAILRSSPFGQVLWAIRLNDARVEQLGWNIRRFRTAIFMISGAYSGIAGALLSSLLLYVSPQTMYWTTSGDILIMTLLGGVGTLLGPVLGVVLYELLKEGIGQITEHWYGILGIIFVLFTIFVPHGAAGLVKSVMMKLQPRSKP